jgi:hypothetical protein
VRVFVFVLMEMATVHGHIIIIRFHMRMQHAGRHGRDARTQNKTEEDDYAAHCVSLPMLTLQYEGVRRTPTVRCALFDAPTVYPDCKLGVLDPRSAHELAGSESQ